MAERGINKATIVGYLGQDPQARHLPDGNLVVTINVATSEIWLDRKSGENRENIEWHRVLIYGKMAEIAAGHLKKGGLVYIEGKIKTRVWQEKSGVTRNATEIIVNTGGVLQMLGHRQMFSSGKNKDD